MQTKRILHAFIAPLALSAIATGCLSKEELEARRQWAYDLSGGYDEVRPEGTEAGSVEIVNEEDKNDVKLVFTRGALYDGEQAYLDRIADEAKREALAAELVLGEGDSQFIDSTLGGENISDNFGQSSEVHVSSERFEATPGVEGATESELYYRVALEIENGSDELKGKLYIRLSERRPDPTEADPDRTAIHVEDEEFAIVLKRKDGPIEGDVCEECLEGPGADAGDAANDDGDAGSTGEGSTDGGQG